MKNCIKLFFVTNVMVNKNRKNNNPKKPYNNIYGFLLDCNFNNKQDFNMLNNDF